MRFNDLFFILTKTTQFISFINLIGILMFRIVNIYICIYLQDPLWYFVYRFDAPRKQKDRLHCKDLPQSAKQKFIKIIIFIIKIYSHIKEIHKYRVTHKEWDCKDDRKLLNCNDPKVKLSILHYL